MDIIVKNALILGNMKKKYIRLLLHSEYVKDNLDEYKLKGYKLIDKFDKNLDKKLDTKLDKINFNNYQLSDKKKIIDFFYCLLGYIEFILDIKTKVGVGYGIGSTILINIFGKKVEKVIAKEISKQRNYVITLTFGEVAENHVGMQKLGQMAKEGNGLNLANFEYAKKQFENLGFECTIIDLVKEGNIALVKPSPQPAYLLIIKDGIKALTSVDFEIDDINQEVLKDSWDKKAFMKGRVVNKLARYNLNYADVAQEPDYEEKKGRVVAFKDAPLVNNIRKELPKFFSEKAQDLFAEGNFYYDLKACGIGFHGDSERRLVIAVRLGDSSLPIHYQWFQQSKPIGDRIIINLNPGDVYAMSEIAVGTNWKKKIIPTLRHATGCKKFLTIKKE